MRGPLAQLAEHLTFNQAVLGSNPRRLTKPTFEAKSVKVAFRQPKKMVSVHMIPLNPQARGEARPSHLINSSELEGLFRLFLYTCKSEGLSIYTIRDYNDKVGQFVGFCIQNGLKDPQAITANHIRCFLVFKQETCKPHSIFDFYRCIKRFFNYLVQEKNIEASPMTSMRPPKIPEKIITPFKAVHIKRLLAQCDLFDNRFEITRNKAIILTFLDSGLRLAELANIQLNDIDEDNEIIKVVGKGAKERLIRICPKVLKAICHYIIIRNKTYPNSRDQDLWVGKEGKGLSKAGIQKMVIRLGKLAGVEGVRCSPHTFRHTFGTLFAENACDLDKPGTGRQELQTLLGHKTSIMTDHYTASAKTRLALLAHAKYSPVNNMSF